MNEIIINPKFLLIDTSYKGVIKDEEGIEYQFWLVHCEDFIGEYKGTWTVEWFFKKVPISIRHMEPDIVKQFKQSLKAIE
jgi:hypothetical protein